MSATCSFAVALAIAYATSIQKLKQLWHLPPPPLREGFDLGAYTGVPWSVQATLVALVYPIVLAFIALMLQRKAYSTVALRAYVLDSAIAPAGASSVGLLVLMGAEYFATPYITPDAVAPWMAPLLVTNGVWLLINVSLTGFFLSRTIRYIQEEEQQHVFTRVAVDVALRSELTSSVKQHLFLDAPQSEWNFPRFSLSNNDGPQVVIYPLNSGAVAATRRIRGNAILQDVHLHILHYVAHRWNRRALVMTSGHQKVPRLIFPARIGQTYSGKVDLCLIENGPALTFIERLLVRIAFDYRNSRPTALSLSTKRMLEEIGHEVTSVAEQGRFNAAQEHLTTMLQLHKKLLLACSSDTNGELENIAVITETSNTWNSTTFEQSWLSPYRDIARTAVNCLEDDPSLFRKLAYVPASLASALPARPEKLVIDAQNVGTHLMYQLAAWWTRKADASLPPGSMFSGKLPAPLSKVYEGAIVDFIGHWGHLRVKTPTPEKSGNEVVWQSLKSKILVYAAHIDNCARLFLQAVARGDDTGSEWLLDNFIKWWGNQHQELNFSHIKDDYRVRHATLNLATMTWPEAQEFLWDGSEQINVSFAEQALNLALRRYWEGIRLFLILALIRNAGETPTTETRELKYAAAIIQGTPQRRGARVDAWKLDSVDSATTSLLSHLYGVNTDLERLDDFSESLDRNRDQQMVSGWIYSWSGMPQSLETMTREVGILLASLSASRNLSIASSKRQIEQWWSDIDKLENVSRFLKDLRREVLGAAFSPANSVIAALEGHLLNEHRPRAGRGRVARVARQLVKVAIHERRLTLRATSLSEHKVAALKALLEETTFDTSHLPRPVKRLRFARVPDFLATIYRFDDEKKHYLVNVGDAPSEALAKAIGESIRTQLVKNAFAELATRLNLEPANDPNLPALHDASDVEARDFIGKLAGKCEAIRDTGRTPIVLAGHGAPRSYFDPYRWGDAAWQRPLPAHVSIQPTKGGDDGYTQINGVPVFDFDTPNEDCYVVPSDLLSTLTVAGNDGSSALAVEWAEKNESQLRFTVSVRAVFS